MALAIISDRCWLRRQGRNGRVAEWSIAPVLKTGDVKASVGSNPTSSATTLFWHFIIYYQGLDWAFSLVPTYANHTHGPHMLRSVLL